jgi:hypothetical protein
MLLVAMAFVVGGILGAVITAALIAANRRALAYDDFELPVRPANTWAADAAAEQYHDSPRMERFERELAARLGREAAATARERAAAARRALQPRFGVAMRMKP